MMDGREAFHVCQTESLCVATWQWFVTVPSLSELPRGRCHSLVFHVAEGHLSAAIDR